MFIPWSANQIQALCAIARHAGSVILHHRQQATEATRAKHDGSPVTAADHAAQQIILQGLTELTPDTPVVAEEKANPTILTASGTYWLVDPLDGTRDYVAGRDEFSVNIGLLVDHQPVLGMLYAPAKDELYFGQPGQVFQMRGALKTPLVAPNVVAADLKLVTSQREAQRLPIQNWVDEGLVQKWRVCSSAYKFGLMAQGDCNIFLRTGTTYEWDTAAGDAILRALGGQIVTFDGAPLPYSKPDFRNGNFIAYLPGVSRELIEKIQQHT